MDKAPDQAVAGVTPGWAKLRIVDVATGETLERVREADAVAGTVTRTKVDDGGNLMRKGDAFVTETVTLPIRIEWIGEPETPADVADVPATDAATVPAPYRVALPASWRKRVARRRQMRRARGSTSTPRRAGS